MVSGKTTKELDMHLKRETLNNDATELADAPNDLSHLKTLQYYNLKCDFPAPPKYVAMSTK